MYYLRHPERTAQYFLSTPVIYSMIVPIVIFDIWIELYHRVCFKLYGLPYVRRGSYIRIDRQKLQYLRWYQKLNCMYCGYANGALHYWSRIAAETERYWCGIMHRSGGDFIEQPHQANFARFDDQSDFKNKYELGRHA